MILIIFSLTFEEIFTLIDIDSLTSQIICHYGQTPRIYIWKDNYILDYNNTMWSKGKEKLIANFGDGPDEITKGSMVRLYKDYCYFLTSNGIMSIYNLEKDEMVLKRIIRNIGIIFDFTLDSRGNIFIFRHKSLFRGGKPWYGIQRLKPDGTPENKNFLELDEEYFEWVLQIGTTRGMIEILNDTLYFIEPHKPIFYKFTTDGKLIKKCKLKIERFIPPKEKFKPQRIVTNDEWFKKTIEWGETWTPPLRLLKIPPKYLLIFYFDKGAYIEKPNGFIVLIDTNGDILDEINIDKQPIGIDDNGIIYFASPKQINKNGTMKIFKYKLNIETGKNK